ncbi:hypothetical protein PSPO01_01830 [Paraphaeosphaeria sporulosa]
MWSYSPRGPGPSFPCAVFLSFYRVKCSCARFSPTSAVAGLPEGMYYFLAMQRSPNSGASPRRQKHVSIELHATHRGECEGKRNVRCMIPANRGWPTKGPEEEAHAQGVQHSGLQQASQGLLRIVPSVGSSDPSPNIVLLD